MSHIKEYRCLKMVIHQLRRKWTVAPFSKFYDKNLVEFVLTQENIFSERVYFQNNRKSVSLLTSRTRDLQDSLPFERSTCFYQTSTVNFECFQYFNFEKKILKNENIFQKTGVPFFNWKYQDLNRNISIQNCLVRSQC